MPELRRDPVTGRWVCLAPGRASRPEVAQREATLSEAHPADCPFCPGHENLTPPEVAAVRPVGGAPDTPGWRVRVVPNLFPAFSAEDADADLADPLHAHGPALGACEVIIHTPDHRRWLPFLSAEQAELVMAMTWERYRRHSVPGVGSVVPFYNHGRDAGASLAHPHGQVYATRVAAPVLDDEVRGAEEAYRAIKECVFCRMIERELELGVRVVAQSESFVSIAPYASRQPFECWIIPWRHSADFGQIEADEAASLGVFLREVLWRLNQEVGDVPLNWYIHSLPNAAGEGSRSYHWHLEVRPKLSEIAGFEMATGIFINTTAPESAAEALSARGEPGRETSDPT
jgi:UDPglucose--hexose-1-phosphate uridylyltransferase